MLELLQNATDKVIPWAEVSVGNICSSRPFSESGIGNRTVLSVSMGVSFLFEPSKMMPYDGINTVCRNPYLTGSGGNSFRDWGELGDGVRNGIHLPVELVRGAVEQEVGGKRVGGGRDLGEVIPRHPPNPTTGRQGSW